MEKLQELKTAIQEALPDKKDSVVTFSRGDIEVLQIDKDNIFYSPIPYIIQRIIKEGKIVKSLELVRTFEEYIVLTFSNTIRLADVLLALSEIETLEMYKQLNGTLSMRSSLFGGTVAYWNLEQDSLDNQSEETIDYLHSLLIPSRE